MIKAKRYHDISCGHRVAGHESKCAHLHGHNYRIHFICDAERLDQVGRVIDFSVMKALLCEWLEVHWDHKFLSWENDEVMNSLILWAEAGAQRNLQSQEWFKTYKSFVRVPFNPTAENMAEYLLTVVGPIQLKGTGVRLIKVEVEETRKCSASAEHGMVPQHQHPIGI